MLRGVYPDFIGSHRLGERWQSALFGIERVDRQINAKIRVLVRLQAPPPGNGAPKAGVAPANTSAGADLQVCGGERSADFPRNSAACVTGARQVASSSVA